MQGDGINYKHTVTRLCGRTKVSADGSRTLTAAWQLRSSDRASPTPHLSVNWLEFFSGRERSAQIEAIRSVLAGKLNVKAQACLALVPVGEIHRVVNEAGKGVRVLHWPDVHFEYADMSHAGIFDVEQDEDVIAQALSRVECELVPARSTDRGEPYGD